MSFKIKTNDENDLMSIYCKGQAFCLPPGMVINHILKGYRIKRLYGLLCGYVLCFHQVYFLYQITVKHFNFQVVGAGSIALQVADPYFIFSFF
jgi:hypothetical protein